MTEHTRTAITFSRIAERLVNENPGVAYGKMMSSPAITYKGKVFAFYYADKMVFKLGREFNPEAHGIQHWGVLSPFTSKPPMHDWIEVDAGEMEKWEMLAEQALQRMFPK
ncbi:MAG: hypothetical protein R3E39_13865 [Anaerolineae bacterium]